MIRFLKDFDNGFITFSQGDITDKINPSYAKRLIGSGFAEKFEGPEALAYARKSAGMKPHGSRSGRKK